MGTLGTMLNQTQIDTIVTMIVKGELNKSDFEVMKNQMPNLRHVDLSDVKCELDKIPNEAFGGPVNSNTTLKTIVLPTIIKVIGDNAFSYCTGLSGTLNLPTGLTSVGLGAFISCSGFKGSLDPPLGLTKIGNNAFYLCSGFTGSLNLPDGLTAIGRFAFAYARGFNKLVFGNNLVTINENAFLNCDNIFGTIIFPLSLKEIGKGGFKGCGNLYAMRFPHTTPLQYNEEMLPTGVNIEVPTSAVLTYRAADEWNNLTILNL